MNRLSATAVQYAYNGVGQVVGTGYLEPDVMWQQHGIGAKYDPLYDAMQDLGQGALQRIVSVARWMLAAMPQLVACGRLLRTDGQVVVFELPAADAPCVTAPAVPPVS